MEITKQWIKDEYVSLFKKKNPVKGKYITESWRRMQRFLKENPDVTKEEIIKATIGYLNNTDGKYIRFPHYFISKGKGADKISELENWIEIYREFVEHQKGRTDITNTMQ